MSNASFLNYWHAAAAEPLGIYILSSDPIRLKHVLYRARMEAKDPRLSLMQVRTAPNNPSGELWILNPEGPLHAR